MNKNASLTVAGGDLEFRSSYDATLVAEFKNRIPAAARQWDAARKVWVVDPNYGQAVVDLVKATLGLTINLPKVVPPQTEIRLLKIEYLGRLKDKGGELLASGYVDGGWNALFSLAVLKGWFDPDATTRPGEAPTLYAVLGLSKKAASSEIKTAYRRLAKMWHPDVCQEPDAAAQFRRVQEAYEVLGDELKRRKYEAGLALTQSVPAAPGASPLLPGDWMPPLWCGWVLIEGQHKAGRWVVSKILDWQDITNAAGQSMVSFWPAGAKQFKVKWV
jgi:hypothetical protein